MGPSQSDSLSYIARDPTENPPVRSRMSSLIERPERWGQVVYNVGKHLLVNHIWKACAILGAPIINGVQLLVQREIRSGFGC